MLLLKGKELHVLKPLNYERFRVSFSKQTPLFDFIVAHEGIETDFRVWSLARKLKILGRLKLFRFVVTGVGRIQQVAARHGAYSEPRPFR